MKARARAALLSAVVTLAAAWFLQALLSAPSEAQVCLPPCTTTTTTSTTTSTSLTTTTTIETTTTTVPTEWQGSHWTGPTSNGEIVEDGTFSGVFQHSPGTPAIASIDLSIDYGAGSSPSSGCGAAPGKQATQHAPTSTTPTTTPESSTMNFLFEVAFTCNGVYDATATATLDGPSGDTQTLALDNLRVAVPPDAPASLLATDNGNQTVTISWQPPARALPPDVVGYRVSRRDASSQTYNGTVDVDTKTLSYTDVYIGPDGGSYVYKVETVRKAPGGVVTSIPIVTSEALDVAKKGAPPSGKTVGGAPDPGSGGTGTQYFDSSTLPADEGEFGAGDPLANVPGGDTIQRFAGDGGSGLVKPFAAALDIGVWAGLLLFLTRRAASAEKAMLRSVQLEEPA